MSFGAGVLVGWYGLTGLVGGPSPASPAKTSGPVPSSRAVAMPTGPDAPRLAGSPKAPPPGAPEAAQVERGSPSAGVRVAVRVGWALPVGDIQLEESLRGTYRWLVPIGLEVGYRFGRHVSLSGFLEYGFISVQPSLCEQLDCSAHSLRLEVLLAYRFAAESAGKGEFHFHLVPWGALGFGYEAMRVTIGRAGQEAGRTDVGLIFADVQLGLDFMVNPRLGIGPLIAVPIGQSLLANVDTPAGSASYELRNRRVHAWPTLGLRVSYDF